jgi:hypothetical protein
MSETEIHPRLHFDSYFEERAWEVSAKGYYGNLVVELEDGLRYAVFFYDPVRLAQDLQMETENGRPYIAEQGMVVIPEISETNMRLAVQKLHGDGWFNHLRPIQTP